MSKIATLQDISCFGNCSITVALPTLTSLGVETALLPSGILSTHTGGLGKPTFLDLTDELEKIIEHWKAIQLTFDALYTGYIGNLKQFDLILKNKDALLTEDGLLIVDPAMADHGKMYSGLGEEIQNGMKQLVSKADIILPNITEVSILLDEPYKENYTLEEYHQILKLLTDLGPKIAIITGVEIEEGKIGAIAYDASTKEYALAQSIKCERGFHGTGDIFASVVIGYLFNHSSLQESLEKACEFVRECIENTIDDPSHSYGVKLEKTLFDHISN